jgi:hypothetical protein
MIVFRANKPQAIGPVVQGKDSRVHVVLLMPSRGQCQYAGHHALVAR